MAVAVNQPQRREEKDPLDTIAKGLGIAQSIFGIKEAGEKSALLKAQREQEMKANQFSQAAKEAELTDKGFQKETSGDGAVSFAKKPGFKSREDIHKEGELFAKGVLTVPGTDGSITYKRDPNYKGEDSGLSALVKKLDIQHKGLQIQEQLKKSGEAEGGQALAAQFGRRMEQANNVIDKMSKDGFDRTAAGASSESVLMGPLKGLRSGDRRKWDQAEENFVTAVLRPESGAVISPQEMESARDIYFPRFGDGPDIIANKAALRQQAMSGLKVKAGRAWDMVQPVSGDEIMVAGQNKGPSTINLNLKNGGLDSANALPQITPEDAQAELIRRRGMRGKLPK